ncbi:hypothetical protein RND81_07G035700 [Saponaria officinalis]|uniref:Uncharacterized protein n=1 Tax=Saponaria officinalis TaxID=3572 RepID=A0AAW1JM04_SAPOF
MSKGLILIALHRLPFIPLVSPATDPCHPNIASCFSKGHQPPPQPTDVHTLIGLLEYPHALADLQGEKSCANTLHPSPYNLSSNPYSRI